ncbi:MAG: hypothetical protein GWN95_19660 [Gammaproteobacteria bacterium]|nr:hypothetical protein [Gammaproteobacteria bacterium]
MSNLLFAKFEQDRFRAYGFAPVADGSLRRRKKTTLLAVADARLSGGAAAQPTLSTVQF